MTSASGFPIYLSLGEVSTAFSAPEYEMGEEKYTPGRSGRVLAPPAKMKLAQPACILLFE